VAQGGREIRLAVGVGPHWLLGNALHCNGADHDLVNHSILSSGVFDMLDRQLIVQFMVLFYGRPVGDFRKLREGRSCPIDNGFDFAVATRHSTDLCNNERGCRVRNAVTANRFRYIIGRVECPKDFRMDGLRSQTFLALG